MSRLRTGTQASTERDHAVPIDEEVEGDDRRHDEKREDADERLSAGPQAAQEAERARLPPCFDEVADGALHVGERLRPAEPLEQRPALLDEERLQAVDIVRQPVDEACELVNSSGTSSTSARTNDEDEQHEDQERRAEPADARSARSRSASGSRR